MGSCCSTEEKNSSSTSAPTVDNPVHEDKSSESYGVRKSSRIEYRDNPLRGDEESPTRQSFKSDGSSNVVGAGIDHIWNSEREPKVKFQDLRAVSGDSPENEPAERPSDESQDSSETEVSSSDSSCENGDGEARTEVVQSVKLDFTISPSTIKLLQKVHDFFRVKLKVDQAAQKHLPQSIMSQEKYRSFRHEDRMRQRSLDGRTEGLSLEDVLAVAKSVKPIFEERVRELGRRVGLEPDQEVLFEGQLCVLDAKNGLNYTCVTCAPMKSESRCRQKARDDYEGDFSLIGDIVRASLVVDTEEQLVAVMDDLLSNFDLGRVKNRFMHPLYNGYRDVLVGIIIDGHVCELQLHLAAIVYHKEGAHHMYDFLRTFFRGHMDSVRERMKLLAQVVGGETIAEEESDEDVVPQDAKAIVKEILEGDDEDKLRALAELLGPEMVGDALLLSRVEARRLMLQRSRTSSTSRKLGEDGAAASEAQATEEMASTDESKNDLETLKREFDLAQALRVAGDLQGAKELFLKVLACFQAIEGEQLSVANTYQELGNVANDQSEYEEAKAYYQKDLEITINELEEEHTHVANTYTHLGVVAKNQGEVEAAKAYYQKALKMYVGKLGEDHVSVANAYNNLGVLSDEQSEFQEAKVYFEKCLKIRINKLGEEHVSVASTYNNLGLVHQNLGQHEEAKAFYLKDLDISVSKLGQDHVYVGDTYNNLGVVAQEQGEYEEAKDYLQRALKIKTSKLGEDHANVAMIYNNLGDLARHQGNYAEAKVYYQKDIDITICKLGEDHVDVAISYINLGAVADANREYEETKNYYQKALDIFVSKLGADHVNVAMTYNNLGAVAANQCNFEDAKTYHQKALNIRISKLGEEHADVAMSHNNLGAVKQNQGNPNEAKVHFEKAVEIFSRTLGAEHAYTIMAKDNFDALA